MKDKIKFLSNLNRELKLIEQQIVDRAITCLHIAETKLKGDDTFTTDYEVEATVEYYLRTENEEDGEEPVHKYWHKFNYKNTILDKDYFMLLDNGNGRDSFREGSNMPALDEPYCYLLHDIIDHSSIGKTFFDFERIGDKIYDIDCIWVDVIYRDQREVKINGDGDAGRLQLEGN